MVPSTQSLNTANQAQCCMLVLCGIPGSGKSTVAASLAAAAQTSGTAVTCIDFDKHTAASCEHEEEPSLGHAEEFNPEKWKIDRVESLHVVSQALLSTNKKKTKISGTATTTTSSSNPNTSNNKHLVIVDDTMHYRSMRAECWHIARATGAAYLYAHIKCPLEVALRRNKLRPPGQRVPEHVLIRTATIFESPEGSYSSNNHFTYDSDKYQVILETEDEIPLEDDKNEEEIKSGEALWARVHAAWGPPAPPLLDKEAEEARIALARKLTEENLLHQVDVQTRKCLSEVLSSLQHDSVQQKNSIANDSGATVVVLKLENNKLAEELNRERRYVLEQFRCELELAKNNKSSEILGLPDSERARELIEAFEMHCREYILKFR